MKKRLYYLLLALLVFVGCADDEPELSSEPVEYCVNWAWSNGRGGDTRVLSSLLAAGGNNLDIKPEEYPAQITLTCNEKEYVLSRGDATLTECNQHTGFYHGYTSEPTLTVRDARKGVTATAQTDDEDELYAEARDVVVAGQHLKILLHHRKALLRFVFQLHEQYAKIRYVHVKEIVFREAGSDGPDIAVKLSDGGLILNAGGVDGYHCAGYCYVDPETFSTSATLQLKCTYDIYDQDADFTTSPPVDNSAHRTREDVVAANELRLSNLLSGSAHVDHLERGHYYDLRITLNPEYLYVLSEHDNNNHLTIE